MSSREIFCTALRMSSGKELSVETDLSIIFTVLFFYYSGLGRSYLFANDVF